MIVLASPGPISLNDIVASDGPPAKLLWIMFLHEAHQQLLMHDLGVLVTVSERSSGAYFSLSLSMLCFTVEIKLIRWAPRHPEPEGVTSAMTGLQNLAERAPMKRGS